MDIIAQLQDQANKIAYIAFNTVGSLQRDAPASRLAPVYPEQPAPTPEVLAAKNEEPKTSAVAFVQAIKQVWKFCYHVWFTCRVIIVEFLCKSLWLRYFKIALHLKFWSLFFFGDVVRCIGCCPPRSGRGWGSPAEKNKWPSGELRLLTVLQMLSVIWSNNRISVQYGSKVQP